VDRVECPYRRFGEGSGGQQQRPVERQQRQRLEQLAGPLQELLKREPRIDGGGSPDRPWQLGQNQLARQQVRVRKKATESWTLRLLSDQLDQGRGIDVEERQLSARRESRLAPD